MKWEEKVARLQLRLLPTKKGLQPWIQRLFWCRDPWSLSVMETPGLLFIV